jgi:glycerol uptake facilitator-like aquaporin
MTLLGWLIVADIAIVAGYMWPTLVYGRRTFAQRWFSYPFAMLGSWLGASFFWNWAWIVEGADIIGATLLASILVILVHSRIFEPIWDLIEILLEYLIGLLPFP